MARYNGEFALEIVDVNGDTAHATMPINVSDAAVLSDLVTQSATFASDLIACSNGKVIRQRVSFLLDEAQYIIGTTPPSDNKYPSVTDGARIQFSNAGGSRSSLTIPAPLEAVFGAGSMVVDPTQAQVAALLTFYKGLASDRAGNLFNLYKGGVKVGRGARIRRTSLRP